MPAIFADYREGPPMFQVIERFGERKAVYSKSDLEYMLRRGWRKVATDNTSAPVEIAAEHPKPKRKYTRRAPR